MADKEVTIRMYRGFLGDCFLLTFPREVRPFHMLIDFGALLSKHYGDPLMQAVARDIKETTEGHLDIAAATHEHWDHVSGFYQAQEIFDEIEVDRVWVAWTEDDENEAAKVLKRQFKKKKKAVEKALMRLPDEKKNKQLGLYKQSIGELFGFFGPLGAAGGKGLGTAGGKGKVEQAWEYLLSKGKNDYCDPKKRPRELEGLEGVRFYVLGPPEDPEFIKRRLSSKETYHASKASLSLFDSFLAAVAGDDVDVEMRERAYPFEEHHRVGVKAASKDNFFKERYGFSNRSKNEWRRIDDDWLTMAGELALHLDSYTNNTCLALAIELVESGKVLLFPGDAQVGNWQSWEHLSWKVKDSQGKTQTVTTDDLLARTVLYKVGHHGSHNATLRAKGLEKMESPDLVAMIPVHRKTAADQSWEFPYRPLWKRLKEKARGRVLLADAKNINEIKQDAEKMLSSAEWSRFKKMTTFTDLYIEYRIPF
jgi:hypothetical protein